MRRLRRAAMSDQWRTAGTVPCRLVLEELRDVVQRRGLEQHVEVGVDAGLVDRPRDIATAKQHSTRMGNQVCVGRDRDLGSVGARRGSGQFPARMAAAQMRTQRLRAAASEISASSGSNWSTASCSSEVASRRSMITGVPSIVGSQVVGRWSRSAKRYKHRIRDRNGCAG